MNIIDYITTERKERHVRYTDFTEAMLISSQRFYQIMEQDDCSFSTARRMLAVLGQDFDIEGDGETNIDRDGMFRELEKTNIMVEDVEKILDAMGLKLNISDVTEETHDVTDASENKSK